MLGRASRSQKCRVYWLDDGPGGGCQGLWAFKAMVSPLTTIYDLRFTSHAAENSLTQPK